MDAIRPSEKGHSYKTQKETIPIFIGTEPAQWVASRVLEYSILKHSSSPVKIYRLMNLSIPLSRKKSGRPRTGFSFYRFVIPERMGYQGRAVYLDADMQVFGDISELWQLPFGDHKVLCSTWSKIPTPWQKNSHFQPGRQMSVLLLDCGRLDWDVREIVKGLEHGNYTYEELMNEFCIMKSDEIAETIPSKWNSLEFFEMGRTKLVHYTVGHIQPWKNDKNPLQNIWMDSLKEAVEAGFISCTELENAVAKGHIKPSLLEIKPYRFKQKARLECSYWFHRVKHAAAKRLLML